MLWAMTCRMAPNSDAAREKAGPEHLEYMKAKKDVIVLAGSTRSDDGKTVTGAFFLVNCGSRAEAQAFLDRDPYGPAGVFDKVEMIRVNKGQWNPSSAENA